MGCGPRARNSGVSGEPHRRHTRQKELACINRLNAHQNATRGMFLSHPRPIGSSFSGGPVEDGIWWSMNTAFILSSSKAMASASFHEMPKLIRALYARVKLLSIILRVVERKNEGSPWPLSRSVSRMTRDGGLSMVSHGSTVLRSTDSSRVGPRSTPFDQDEADTNTP